jgi:hypothetical protein
VALPVEKPLVVTFAFVLVFVVTFAVAPQLMQFWVKPVDADVAVTGFAPVPNVSFAVA